METTDKIALGGGCHWCTEAIFQSLLGVCKVEQGYVAPNGKEASFSEAIIVHFNHSEITLKVPQTIPCEKNTARRFMPFRKTKLKHQDKFWMTYKSCLKPH